MKIILLITTIVFLLNCNNESRTLGTTHEAKTPESKVVLPFKLAYDGTPSIGKMRNVATVMKFNGDFIAGKVENIGSYFADSVHVIFASGREITTVRDTVVAQIKGYWGSISSARQSYIAAIAVDNKEKGDEWVFQWIDESHDFKDGKKDHRIYHQDYRLENGKIREMLEYAQEIPTKK